MKFKTKRNHLLARRWLAAVCLGTALVVTASPWDSWRMAYTSFEKGEKLRDSGDYVHALAAFTDALKHYQSVRVARPDWNQRVISARIAECDRERSKIQTLLGKSSAPVRQAEQGGKQLAAVSSEVTLLKRQLAERDAEIQKLQADAGRGKRLEAEIANLIRDQRQAAEKYALLKRQLETREKTAELPSALAQKLKKRLEEEKVRVETLSRQEEALTGQLKKQEESIRSLVLARDAAELELKRTREALASKGGASAGVPDGQEATRAEMQKLRDALADSELRRETALKQCDVLKKDLAATAEKLRLTQSAAASGKPQTDSPVVAENRRLFHENSSLKEELAAEQTRSRQASAKVQEGRTRFMELEGSLQRVVSARNAVEKENFTLRSSLEQAEKKLQESAPKLAEETALRTKWEQDFRLLAQKNRELENRLDERAGKDFADMTASKEKLERLNAEMDQLQTALLNWKHQTEALMLEKQQLTADLKSAAEAAKKSMEKQKQTSEALRKAVAAADQVRDLPEKYQELQKNFEALQAENRENRLLAEAAKPREAELANIKLRLADLDRLKGELAREQRLNGELLISVRKLEKQLTQAKEHESQLLTMKRDLPEIETLRRDLEKFRKLNGELVSRKMTEGDVSSLKLKLADAEARAADRDRLQKINSELLAMQKAQSAELTSIENRKLDQELKDLLAISGVPKAADAKDVDLKRQSVRIAEENVRLKNSLAQQKRLAADAQNTVKNENAKRRCAEAELAKLRKINAELASARAMEGEVAKLRQQLTEAETMRGEVARLERLCRELSADKVSLEKELTDSRNSPVPGVSVIPSPVKENPDDLVTAGALAESEGNLELAVWNYRQALQADKEHSAAAKRLGRICFLRQEYREAMPLLAIARTAAPKDVELGYMAARSAIELKRFGNAKGILEPLLKAHPNDWRLQTCQALVEMGCGETANAEKRLQFAQRLAPGEPQPRIELARIVVSSAPSRREEAARIYESARMLGAAPDLELERQLSDVLDKRRDSASFLTAAAGEAESAGDWKSAVWYYRQLQDLGWMPETTVPKLAFARYKEGNSAAALEVLQFAPQGKNAPLAEIVAMLICYRTGNPIGAVAASRRALAANGGVPVEIPADCGALNSELLSAFSDNRKSGAEACREAFRGI